MSLVELSINSNKTPHLVSYNTTTNIIFLPIIEKKKRQKGREGQNNDEGSLAQSVS